MSYRFTNTDKWNDAWFSTLNPNEKLLFMFLCDNCDVAGFIEINIKIWQVHTGLTENAIKGALKGLQRGLTVSDTNDCIYVKNFLKHQKNLPLNAEKNMAHRGIVKRFEVYKDKFNIENIDEFLEAPSKPLDWGYGIGKGIDIGNTVKEKSINVKDQYKEWAENSTNEKYKGFVDWMFSMNFKVIYEKADQIDEEKFISAMQKAEWDNALIKSKIMGMENDKRFEKDRKSFYLTLLTWLDRK